MRKYDKEPRRNYFVQGFRLGLIFGALGAIIILGRDHSPQQTLEAEATNNIGSEAAESVKSLESSLSFNQNSQV
jgi:hypothetical protein